MILVFKCEFQHFAMSFLVHWYNDKNVKVECIAGLNNYADSILTLIGRGTNGIISGTSVHILTLSRVEL